MSSTEHTVHLFTYDHRGQEVAYRRTTPQAAAAILGSAAFAADDEDLARRQASLLEGLTFGETYEASTEDGFTLVAIPEGNVHLEAALGCNPAPVASQPPQSAQAWARQFSSQATQH